MDQPPINIQLLIERGDSGFCGQLAQPLTACVIWANFFSFKVLLNVLQYHSVVIFWFFGHETCGILVPQPGIELHPLHWKAES